MNGPSSWSRQNFRLLNQEHKIRFVLTIVLGLLVLGGGEAITDPVLAYAGVFLMASALLVSRFVVKQPNRPLKTQFQISAVAVGILNIVAVTLLLQGTGGMHSGFFSLFLVTIVFASVIFRGIELAVLTALCACFYILVSLPLDTGSDWWQVGARLTGLIIVAWYAYSLSDVLHHEKEANDQLLRHLTEGIMVLDSRERVTLINPTLLSMISGISEEKIIGRSRQEVAAQDNLLGWLLADVGETSSVAEYRSRIGCFPEADLPLVECNTIECRSEEGSDGWVIVCRDLRDQPQDSKTARRPLYDKLAPLSNLRALSQALYGMAEYLDDSRRWQVVSAIEQHTQALQGLLAEMLHSTTETTSDLQLTFVDVSALLSNTRRLLEIQPGGVGAPVEILTQEGVPEISADRNRLGHVLLQLAKALLALAQPGDRILLSARTAPGGVCFALELLAEGASAAVELQPVAEVGECLPQAIIEEMRDLEIVEVVAQHHGEWECSSHSGPFRRVAFRLPVQGPLEGLVVEARQPLEAGAERQGPLSAVEPLSAMLAAEVFNQLKNAISAIRGNAELALRHDDPARSERALSLAMDLSDQASDLVESLQPSRVDLDFGTAHRAAEEARQETEAPDLPLPLLSDADSYLLVVDDDPAVRTLLVDALSGVGYRVQSAEDGKQAVEYIKATPPVMAFVDISMPRVTGIEVLREAKKHAPGMPVVLMTGYAYAVAVEAIGEEKPYALLSKPFSISELVSLARSVAGNP